MPESRLARARESLPEGYQFPTPTNAGVFVTGLTVLGVDRLCDEAFSVPAAATASDLAALSRTLEASAWYADE